MLDIISSHSLNSFCLDFLFPPSHWLGNATIRTIIKVLCCDDTATSPALDHLLWTIM